MTILIHEYYELQERAGKHMNVWKAWHITIFIFAAIFGVLNYLFLQKTMYMVEDNCVLYPPKLEFHNVDIHVRYTTGAQNNDGNLTLSKANETDGSTAEPVEGSKEVGKAKREAVSAGAEGEGNVTQRMAVDIMQSYFGSNNECEYAEYMPLMATVIALVWITFFTMCPGGGRPRSGLPKPWRILAPALIFSLLLVGLTGHSFTQTNSGLRGFCAAFYNHTNATTCSSANNLIERSWNATWQFGGRAEATRAASAGLWASWACAAALLLARCLTAPDFQLRATAVHLASDPHQKITPHLRKSLHRSPHASPNIDSIRSEPTAMTELVTASVEQGQDSAPTTRDVTPEPQGDVISMSRLDRP